MKNKHSSTVSFGSLIRKLRTDLNITQRDLAKKLGIAPSYLNDLEKEKRGAPKQATIKKLATILKTSLNQLNDLAGASKKELAPDITEYILSNPKIVSLIRSIKANNLDQSEINKIQVSLDKKKNKSLNYSCWVRKQIKESY